MEKIVEYIKLPELKQRGKDVELKSNYQVEARVDGLQSENKHISPLNKWIQDFSVQLTSKERQLNLALKEIERCNVVLREELDSVQKEHEECSKELAMKKMQLGIIDKSIQQQNEEFKSNEEKLGLARTKLEECCKDLAVKNKQLESVEESLQVLCKEFEVKEKEVENLKSSAASCNFEIKLKQTELAMKTNQLSTVERSIEERIGKLKSEDMKLLRVKDELEKCYQDLSVKAKQLELVQKELEVIEKEVEKVKTSAANCNEELEMKQKQLEVLQGLANVHSKEQISIENSITECYEELESKTKNLELVKISLKECCNDLTSKEAEFDSMQRKICGLSKEIKEREKHLDSLKTTLEERSTKLEMKEKQFEARLKEFELKEQQTHATCQNRQALEPHNSWTSIDEKTSPSMLTDNMGDNDLLPNEVLAAFQSSADPAMFVLGVVRYSQHRGLDASVKTKILLMEKVIEISARISPVVKAEALKQAVSWKANLSLGSEKLTEVWAFLLFVAAYRLMNYFGGEEILKLVLVVAAKRNAPDLCRLLDFTDKIPEIIERLIERKQHLDAARFTIAFGLLHIFPLQFILQNCFEHIKGKAIDEELSVLKAVIHCISDYKLTSRIDKQIIHRRITELENEKALCSRAASLLTHASFNTQQQHLHNQNYREELLFGGNSKRAKTGTSYPHY